MDEYRNYIRNELSELSRVGKSVFAALTCEKLYPNYVSFKRLYGWGNEDILQEAIISIYQSLLTDQKNESLLETIKLVEEITPDTENFDSILTSFALDACTAVYSTLSFLVDNKIDHVVDVATYARDTVDMFIQEVENLDYNNSDIEETIARNSYMISEKKRQKDIIGKLRSLNDSKILLRLEDLRDRSPIIDTKLISDI